MSSAATLVFHGLVTVWVSAADGGVSSAEAPPRRRRKDSWRRSRSAEWYRTAAVGEAVLWLSTAAVLPLTGETLRWSGRAPPRRYQAGCMFCFVVSMSFRNRSGTCWNRPKFYSNATELYVTEKPVAYTWIVRLTTSDAVYTSLLMVDISVLL